MEQDLNQPTCCVKDCNNAAHFSFCGIWICKQHQLLIEIRGKTEDQPNQAQNGLSAAESRPRFFEDQKEESQ